MIDKLKVEYIPIDQLKEYERNAKEHPEAHIKQIAESIKEFGFNDPIGIDSDNTIIEGHGRLFAARKLKLKEVPIIRIGHLTDDQKKAYIIAHNKLTMNTGFDLEILFNELESLDGDLQTLTGFNDEEISDIFNQLSEDIKEKKISEDFEWDYISETGDIWELNDHRIICGDTTEPNTFKRLLQGKKADLIVTDPPYNVNYQGHIDSEYNRVRKDIQNDNLGDEFKDFLEVAYKNFEINLKPGGVFYMFYANGDIIPETVLKQMKELEYRQTLIWVKDRHSFGRSDYQWRHEPILYGYKLGADRYLTFDRTQTTVIDDLHNKDLESLDQKQLIEIIKEFKEGFESTIIYEDRLHNSKLHPTMKPVNLMKRFIRNSSKLNELVLDGFLGSGSTLIASDQLKRICYGIEYEPKYIDITVARFIQSKLEEGSDFNVTLIRNGKEYNWEETGIEEVLDLI